MIKLLTERERETATWSDGCIRWTAAEQPQISRMHFQPAHLVAHQRTQHSIVVRPTAVRTFRRTSFARRSFSTAAPMTWNSLPPAVLNWDSLSQDLKLICFLLLSVNYSTFLFRQRLCNRLTVTEAYYCY